jgi:phospholipid/cholesterol/gamma-HCH transport system substrate-binding protein
MAKVTQAAKVGVFAFATASGLYFVTRVISKNVGSGGGYTVHTNLKDATGLVNHSRVTMAGIPIGTIEAIKLENGTARVEVAINKDLALYDNATIGKKSTSLLGEFALVLTPGTEDHRKLKEGDAINVTIEQATTDQIMNDVARIADRIKVVSEQLAQSLGTEQGGNNMKAILQNLAEVTDSLNHTVRENRELIHSTLIHVDSITSKSEPHVLRILENIRSVTEDVKSLMAQSVPGKNGETNKAGDLRDTMERINRASKSLESALAHIDSVSGRLDRGEGTIGKLTKDETLVNEVTGVAEGINDYVERLNQVQTVVGLRSDYNFLANTIKSYVELRLQPREDKYYVIELINDPRGRTNFTQQDVNTTNPNEPSNYRTITVTTTDAFRFSLQFARRLGPFTGRFGIKESTGGLGLDVHLFANRMEITQDLFGFGEDIKPRYRVYLGYEFIRHLWLLGGVDHLFFANRRDYFLGLTLRFTDQDLKSILPFAGSANVSR